ncbi:tryptophan halogenase [Variovorax sp. YR266]|uniref:tryptophan halogenase family protein n=1 Tax=Variovorax sp. YR266 TaxID=1884386 RepID=UPI00089D4FC3|nr:tryptophan halogenase family protein [Variovorax sp. YR266]SDZ68536.1 tryptophan halogenase [Variovorax sp. YR266]
MLNLRNATRAVVIGGGTAGWFAALTLRRVFAPQVEIRVIESPEIGIVGVGEGGLLNLIDALRRNGIDVNEFVRETGTAFKLGFSYEGWRTGAEDDRYYHLFGRPGLQETDWMEGGFRPLFSGMVREGVELHRYIPGFAAIASNASQQEAAAMLQLGARSGLSASFHFDSHKLADYLRRVAVSRGVVHQQAHVEELMCDAQDMARGVRIDDGEIIDLDLLIDASGLARLGIGKKLGIRWRSFSEHLLLDRAVPFHMPHPQQNPSLVTRAIAMPAGWMWQIPLVERVGAGYVFSSAHTDETQVIDEIHRCIGPDVEPMRTLRFEPGHFEQVWVGNVMAIGLASGFVEPLEATSIGQMLEQLRNFERIVTAGDGVVSGHLIDGFNEANARCWSGIRDFLRMHYDCPRRDTAFWRDVAALPLPPSYSELRQCFQQRTPRLIDVQNYAIHGWQGIFHVINWLFVAAPLGVVPPEAAAAELASLPAASRQRVAIYMNRLRELGAADSISKEERPE